MELTGLQIFKYLPAAQKSMNTNCKKCGCATCMAFALKLAKKQIDIEKCQYAPIELKEKFDEVSKIQQHEVQLSADVVAGGETVMYRHDKTFVNETVISIALNCEDSDFNKKLDKISTFQIERIGQIFKVDAIYLEGNKDSDFYKKSLKRIKDKGFAVIEQETDDYKIVTGENLENLVKNSEDSLKLCKKLQILELSAKNKKVKELVEELTLIRRAAIQKRFASLVYPVLVKIPSNLTNLEACSYASLLICRYANVLVFDYEQIKDYSLLATIFTLRQCIYTNPQKPLQVESKIYEFNEPNENSPVLLTTNFALTYFAVASELESLSFGTYLVVTPSDGMSVLTAWSADKFTADIVAKSVKNYDLLNKVKTRTIIIPGLLSHMKDELQEAMPEWVIEIGTVEAFQIPEFLKNKIRKVV